MTFLFLFRLLLGDFPTNFMGVGKPAVLRAHSYIGFALSNSALSQERSDRRLFTIKGSCFSTAGGWLDSTFTYSGELFGFLNGKYFPEFRSNVASRKSVQVKFFSIVMSSS